MAIQNRIAEQISEWKSARDAVILAHHYQDDEIQQLADKVGDTLELAQSATGFAGKVIVLCGVKFMAELAKVLNPKCTVVLPDLKAGCSLADSCPAPAVRAFREHHPDDVIVSSMNTSIEVKAESDILCTSRNALQVVNSIPAQQPILFLPDINLGNWVKKQTGRHNMQIWQGACIVHATVSARRLATARCAHPLALVAAHPGCASDILRMADFVGSVSGIMKWCGAQSATEFIVCAESGMLHSLQKSSPEKQFYFVENENCNCSECPYMRMNTLEKLLTCLQTLTPRIEMANDLMARARLPYQRMLEIQ